MVIQLWLINREPACIAILHKTKYKVVEFYPFQMNVLEKSSIATYIKNNSPCICHWHFHHAARGRLLRLLGFTNDEMENKIIVPFSKFTTSYLQLC